MADLRQGFLLELRRSGVSLPRRTRSMIAPSDADVFCRNTSGGTLTGAVAGSDVVMIDWSNFTRGLLPPIAKFGLTAANGVLGVVHWDAGSVANGSNCWVRVFGTHPYALVYGGTAVAIGDPLGYASGLTVGELRPVSAFGSAGCVALAAQAAAAQVATAVHVLNRIGIALN